MKLITDHSDFYDTICAQHYDDGLVFKRKSSEPVELNYEYNWIPNRVVVVGFCNKIYLGYIVNYNNDNLFKSNPVKECIWGLDKIIAHVKPSLTNTIVKRYGKWEWMSFERKIESILSHDWQTIFAKYGPIWLLQAENYTSFITSNPLLNRYQFAKAMPPLEAYLALRNYISNVASPPKEIPQVSDEMMAEIKGFDSRTSFRRDKGQGPKRKRKQ